MNIREHDFDQDPPSADTQAGEYVLGVLNAGERRAAEAKIVADPAFARLVDGWERRLAPLIDEIAPVEAPAHVWPRIRTRLGWAAVERSGGGGLLNSVNFWRAATGFAAAAAVAAIFIGRVPQAPVEPVAPPVAVEPTPAPQPTPQPAEADVAKPVTILANDSGNPAWLVSVDPVKGTVLMVPIPQPADGQGRVPELWVIPSGQAPISLGVVSNERSHTVTVPAQLRRELEIGSTLAITLEPSGGAPQGKPTGPVIAKGGILEL